ncbi:LysR family transcriptional regulator [Bradyrhizobium sp. 139]|uniref:LysR family transcriptional regulator n=1 Tax=Bradyrhizobium sp. 139 TaxID=2782616 RepID=UPI001FF79078|nr:LysR substrate-binding domain-containing protein [Bradyrhizobium sp. 139]MCK1742070.1 LysR family transcriptional regulator [Bradyrhizobium sp. 139]
MDLRQLRYFLGAVEHGSIAKAADGLHVAQSAISLHLSRLEKELGCTLVHRTSRGIVPTESGIRLVNRARSLLSDLGTIAEEVRGIEAVPAGSVVVGIPTSLGISLTVPLALAVRREYPLIRLRIAEGLSGHMSQWLLSGQLDLALVFGSESIPGLAKERLGSEHLNLVGAKGAEAINVPGEVSISALFDLPLILPGRPHGLREEVERAASRNGYEPNVIMEVDSLEGIKTLVAEGIGYTVLSTRVADYGPTSSRLRHRVIGRPRIERSIYIAHSSKTPLSAAANRISKVLAGMCSHWQSSSSIEE